MVHGNGKEERCSPVHSLGLVSRTTGYGSQINERHGNECGRAERKGRDYQHLLRTAKWIPNVGHGIIDLKM